MKYLTLFKSGFIATVGAMCFSFSMSAHAGLIIDPAVITADYTGNDTSQAVINNIITPLIAPATFLYKQDVGTNGDSGPLAGSYQTTFSNSPGDPEDALIEYLGGAFAGPTAWLLVKDGNSNPAWYLFDLTNLGWDGQMDIELENFWPGRGAISHVSLYGTEGVDVPEPSTLLLMALGMLILTAVARRKQLTA